MIFDINDKLEEVGIAFAKSPYEVGIVLADNSVYGVLGKPEVLIYLKGKLFSKV